MDKKTKMKFNILAIFAIVIFCISITPVTLQNDTYYTIAIGEKIMQSGIDMQDPFSWHEGLSYTYPHWLYDVGTYLVYNIGGFQGIYIATVVLSCILGLAIYFTNTKLTKNNLTSFILTIGAMYLLKDFIAARAQLVTFILFILTIFFIEKFLDTKKKRYAIPLIIIPILIANLHLAVWPFYFVLYLPYIAEYLICLFVDSNIFRKIKIKSTKLEISKLQKKLEKFDVKQIEENITNKVEKDYSKQEKLYIKLKENLVKNEEDLIKNNNLLIKTIDKRKEERENPYKIKIIKKSATKWLIVIMIICLFTGLLTPLKDTPYTYLIKTMEGNTTDSISEHQPLVLIQNKQFICILILLLAILIFTDTKIRLRDLFMIGGLLLLSFMQRRQTSMFILIGTVAINRLICYICNKYDPEGIEKTTRFLTTLIGKIITILVIAIISLYFLKPKIGNKIVSTSSYPVAAADYILENLDIENMRLYNEYNYGSYLLFRGIPVFIDSRADLYAPEFNGTKDENGKYQGKDIFSDFINTANINVYYEETMKKYEITHVITGNNAKVNLFLSRDSNYKQLYKDDNFTIYERNAPNN